MIFLQGNPVLDKKGAVPTGRLSGIVANHVPKYLLKNRLPSYAVNTIADWETKVDAIVDEPVDIILRSVSEKRLRDRQSKNAYPVNFPPEQVCFQHILQRVDRIAARQGTHALIIADERGDRERHRDRFATYQTEGTPGVYMHTTLDTLLDTVHFAPSHRSRTLQAADVLAFVNRRFQTVAESDPRAAENMRQLWAKIVGRRCFDHGHWP